MQPGSLRNAFRFSSRRHWRNWPPPDGIGRVFLGAARVSSPDIRANVGAPGVVLVPVGPAAVRYWLPPVVAVCAGPERMFAVLVRLISRFSWPRSGPIEPEKLNVCDNAPAMLTGGPVVRPANLGAWNADPGGPRARRRTHRNGGHGRRQDH